MCLFFASSIPLQQGILSYLFTNEIFCRKIITNVVLLYIVITRRGYQLADFLMIWEQDLQLTLTKTGSKVTLVKRRGNHE